MSTKKDESMRGRKLAQPCVPRAATHIDPNGLHRGRAASSPSLCAPSGTGRRLDEPAVLSSGAPRKPTSRASDLMPAAEVVRRGLLVTADKVRGDRLRNGLVRWPPTSSKFA